MEKKKDLVQVDIVDTLLDDKNTGNITMFNDNGEPVEFAQIAVIPKKKNLYCILKPINQIEGIASNEAVVFKVIEEQNQLSYLAVVEDQKVAEEVFSEYEKLVTREIKKQCKETVKRIITEDVNLFSTFSRGKEKIDFNEYLIHPIVYLGTVYVIIQDTLTEEGALVWKIVTDENGESRLEWEEDDFLAFFLVERFRKWGGK